MPKDWVDQIGERLRKRPLVHHHVSLRWSRELDRQKLHDKRAAEFPDFWYRVPQHSWHGSDQLPPLVESINKLTYGDEIDSYIKENDISLVIDKQNMLGGKPEHDITKFIVEKLNQELPSLNLK